MKRRELTSDQKLDLLENIIARLFGWWGSVKVDWEQDYMGPRVILRNVDLDGDKVNLISDLKNRFNLEIDSRSIVEEDDNMIPMKGGKDLARKYRYIHNEIDLTISPNYEQYLLNQTPEELEDIRKGTTAKWTEDDKENRDHRYFSMDGGSLHPTLFRLKRTPEDIKESIQNYKNSIKHLRKELKKVEEGNWMTKIVILGSCRFSPYEILAKPDPIPGAWNTDRGYKMASDIFYPAMDDADEIWVYAPDGIGEHTQKDIDYAESIGKTVKVIE